MKYARILTILGALILLTQASAFAAPSFTSSSASVITSGTSTGDLLLSWTETGLTYPGSVAYSFSADVAATYACVSSGSAFVETPDIEGTVESAATLPISRKGTISQKAVLFVLSGASEPCPSGSTQVLYQVTWTNAVILDTSNDVSPVASASASVTFCNVNKNPNKCPAI